MILQILAGLNESSQPCQDFWEFGCGGWLGKNPIPKSKASWSSEQQEQYKCKIHLFLSLCTYSLFCLESKVMLQHFIPMPTQESHPHGALFTLQCLEYIEPCQITQLGSRLRLPSNGEQVFAIRHRTSLSLQQLQL